MEDERDPPWLREAHKSRMIPYEIDPKDPPLVRLRREAANERIRLINRARGYPS